MDTDISIANIDISVMDLVINEELIVIIPNNDAVQPMIFDRHIKYDETEESMNISRSRRHSVLYDI